MVQQLWDGKPWDDDPHPAEPTGLRVIRADPVIHIADLLVRLAAAGNLPFVTLIGGVGSGAVFTIHARNRTVVYRLGDWDPVLDVWPAEWPD